MKLVIASDIHGAAEWCERLMAQVEELNPDRVVLLGDLLYHGPRNDLPADYAPKRVIEMLNSIADQVIAVRGNCEAEVDQMVLAFPCMADHNVLVDSAANNKTLFFTHGHVYGPVANRRLEVLQKASSGFSCICVGGTSTNTQPAKKRPVGKNGRLG